LFSNGVGRVDVSSILVFIYIGYGFVLIIIKEAL